MSADGNVVVTGYSESSTVYPYNRDWATIAYSKTGVPLWTNRYDGPANNDDEGAAIGADANGRVFVTGYSYGSGGTRDYATIAYSGAGVPLWTNRYNGPGNIADVPTALAVDRNGNVFVTGYSAGSGSGNDFATIKYSSVGLPLWTNRFGGPTNDDDRAVAIFVTTNGNVFVTGYSGPGAKQNLNYVTISYSSTGVPLWTNRYAGPGNSSIDSASAIAADAEGRIFVTGGASNGTNNDFLTIAYSNAGVPLWTNRYGGPGNSTDGARAIAVGAGGNVFVAGNSSLPSGYADYATVAYSNSGMPLWTNRYNGTGNDTDSVSAIALDANGNVFVTGISMGSVGFLDYATIRYSVVQPLPLAIQPMNGQVVLSWTNAAFGLQSAPFITGTFTNLPGATSPYTNPISGSQRFFRLISN